MNLYVAIGFTMKAMKAMKSMKINELFGPSVR